MKPTFHTPAGRQIDLHTTVTSIVPTDQQAITLVADRLFSPESDSVISHPIKLLMVDFDGTLADTRRANYLSYSDILQSKGVGLSWQEYNDLYFGLRCTEFMEHLGFSDPTEREAIRRRKIEIYPSHFDTVVLNKPLWEFMQAFRSLGGHAWIVSTGSRDNIINVMRHLGIEGGVDGILTGADITNCKPAPECFLKAMQIVGVTPHQSMIFEDSTIGIEAAQRSGASYVVVKF